MKRKSRSASGDVHESGRCFPPASYPGLLAFLLVTSGAQFALAAPAVTQDLTKQPVAPPKPLVSPQTQTATQPIVATQKLDGAKSSPMPGDVGTDHLGGRVYSTGTEDIVLKILSAKEIRDQALKKNRASSGEGGFDSAIWLSAVGRDRLIGSSHDGGKTVNLGKIPPSELVFSIKTPQRRTFKTGEAANNPDNQPHAILRSFKSGMLQVWFEDTLIPKGSGKSDRDFNDTVLQLTGGVVDNGTVVELLRVIREQTGEARATAIAMLKKTDPKAAAAAGFR